MFEKIQPLLKGVDIVVLSDYAKGVLSPNLIQRIIDHSSGNVLVDPKGKDYSRYSGCRLITPNRKEAEEATGIKLKSDEDLKEITSILFNQVGLRELVITLGADGIYYAKNVDEGHMVRAQAQSVYDVTERAKEVCEEIQNRGETLVFTHGSFDLIHGRHIRFLGSAKSLGDYLMVGVADDGSVKRQKGPEHPILSLEERMEIVASLQMVDYVVSYSEDTPYKIIQSLSPNVLVKAEDSKDQDIDIQEWIENHGGEVVLTPLREGYSPDSVIERVIKRQSADSQKQIQPGSQEVSETEEQG